MAEPSDAILHAAHRAGPFLITHKSYSHRFQQGWHEHPVASVDFVLAGGGVGVYAGDEVESRPGAVEYFGPGVRHRFRAAQTGISTMHVVATPDLTAAANIHAPVVVRRLDASRTLPIAVDLASEILATRSPDLLLLESLALSLLEEIGERTREPADDAGWIARVREVLLDSAEQAESLQAIADEVGLHRSHVARHFKRTEGVTIGEYGRRVRLARAARRLAERSPPAIAAIALQQGFGDQAHFSRAFKSLYGCTPGAFWRRFRDR